MIRNVLWTLSTLLVLASAPGVARAATCGDEGVKCPARADTEKRTIFAQGLVPLVHDCARLDGLLQLRPLFTHESATIRSLVTDNSAASEITYKDWFELSRIVLTRSSLTKDAVRVFAHSVQEALLKYEFEYATADALKIPDVSTRLLSPLDGPRIENRGIEGGFGSWQEQIMHVENVWGKTFNELTKIFHNFCVVDAD